MISHLVVVLIFHPTHHVRVTKAASSRQPTSGSFDCLPPVNLGFSIACCYKRERVFVPIFERIQISAQAAGADEEIEKEKVLPTNKTVSQLVSLFWQMASPYYQESKTGRWLFWGVIGLTLINSGVSVAFSYLGKDFWNALSSKDVEAFYGVLKQYVPALLVGAPVATYYKFQRAQLAVSWREWMTDRTLQIYASQRIYYALERGQEIDNPDQRIAEDVNSFTGYSLQLFITIVTSIIDLVSFSFILYSIYPQLFGAIIIYSAFGTFVTAWIGKSLVRLQFQQLQKEGRRACSRNA
jgi:ABC-type uncharacterized transport system fused permease/ATPase subunit